MHPLIQHFRAVAQERATSLAVVAGDAEISYGDLWELASRLARRLEGVGVRPGDRVALVGDRGVEDFVGLLAIWLVGAAYLPLSLTFPSERSKKILLLAGAEWMILGPQAVEYGRCLSGFDSQGDRISIAELTWVLAPTGGLVSVHSSAGVGEGPLGYLMFTSGSTGEPKGVPVTLDNLSAYLNNIQSLYPLRPEDRVSQLAQLSFDASLHEFAWCWFVGACLCVVPTRSILMWPRYFADLRVTATLLIPSSVNLAAKAGLLGKASLPDLRLIFLGAEAVTRSVVRVAHAASPEAKLVNLWGPTEATVFFSHYPISPEQLPFEITPIGWPLPGQSLKLVDGELLQSGSQVVKGYWHQPQLNAEKFLEEDGRTWYRSGDKARWDVDHGYIYMGRVDRQVKLLGYRIELQAVESAVREASEFTEVAVVPLRRPQDDTVEGLVCFIASDLDWNSEHTAALQQLLPGYMVPKYFRRLSALPLGNTGKIDVLALERQVNGGSPRESGRV